MKTLKLKALFLAATLLLGGCAPNLHNNNLHTAQVFTEFSSGSILYRLLDKPLQKYQNTKLHCQGLKEDEYITLQRDENGIWRAQFHCTSSQETLAIGLVMEPDKLQASELMKLRDKETLEKCLCFYASNTAEFQQYSPYSSTSLHGFLYIGQDNSVQNRTNNTAWLAQKGQIVADTQKGPYPHKGMKPWKALLGASLVGGLTEALGQVPAVGASSTYFIEALGGVSTNQALSAIETSDNGLVAAGYTNSFGAGGYDFLITKLYANSSLNWAQTLGGTSDDQAWPVIETSDKGLVAAGLTDSYGAGGADFLITKLYANGSLNWAQTLGGALTDYAWSIIETSDKGLVVVGYTSSFGAGSNDFLITKLCANGSLSWAKTFGGVSDDQAWSVIETSDTGLVVAGLTSSFGAGSYDFLITKLYANGSFNWAKTLGAASNDQALSITETSDGGLVAVGFTDSFGAGNDDFLIAKMDSSGSLSWAKTLGGTSNEMARSIIETSDGSLVVAGWTQSFGAGGYDCLIAQLSTAGCFTWIKTLGGTLNDQAFSVIETNDGGLAIAGFTNSTGSGSYDYLLAKLSADGEVAESCIEIKIQSVPALTSDVTSSISVGSVPSSALASATPQVEDWLSIQELDVTQSLVQTMVCESTLAPTGTPTNPPTGSPAYLPSFSPTDYPSQVPSGSSTQLPYSVPTTFPTAAPRYSPSLLSTSQPTGQPSAHKHKKKTCDASCVWGITGGAVGIAGLGAAGAIVWWRTKKPNLLPCCPPLRGIEYQLHET